MKMSKLAGPGARYIGPLPPEEISGRLAFRKIPSEAWQAAHPPGVPCDPPTDEDMVVQCVLMGSYGYPSRIRHPQQWDRGQFPVTELACVPYLDWKQAGDADIARQRGVPPEDAMAEAAEKRAAALAAGAGEDDGGGDEGGPGSEPSGLVTA